MLGVVSDYVAVAVSFQTDDKLVKHNKPNYLAAMSTGYRIDDQYAIYFLTLTVVDWVDVFSRKGYRDIVIDSLKYCISEKGLKLYCYVIMTNHVHLIAHSPK